MMPNIPTRYEVRHEDRWYWICEIGGLVPRTPGYPTSALAEETCAAMNEDWRDYKMRLMALEAQLDISEREIADLTDRLDITERIVA